MINEFIFGREIGMQGSVLVTDCLLLNSFKECGLSVDSHFNHTIVQARIFFFFFFLACSYIDPSHLFKVAILCPFT